MREALLTSVTCSAPPVRFQISQLSTVPNASSPRSARARAPGTWSSSQASFVAEKYGSRTRPVFARTLSSTPVARSSAHRSAVRRSCQTMALATGAPVARSHSTTVSRWLVTPMAAMSEALAPACLSADRAHSSCVDQISAASCSTQPGLGKICWNSFWAVAMGEPRRSNTMARELVVPWSSASTYFDMFFSGDRSFAAASIDERLLRWQTCPGSQSKTLGRHHEYAAPRPRGFRGRLCPCRRRARPRAGVADETGPDRRAVPPGRHDRHRRPLARRGAAEDVGATGRHRQPRRRRRQHRRGRRRQESGRRLHGADGHRRHACDQRRPVRAQRTEDAVRSGEGLRSRHALRGRAERDGDQSRSCR